MALVSGADLPAALSQLTAARGCPGHRESAADVVTATVIGGRVHRRFSILGSVFERTSKYWRESGHLLTLVC